jgi:hypothetical protein
MTTFKEFSHSYFRYKNYKFWRWFKAAKNKLITNFRMNNTADGVVVEFQKRQSIRFLFKAILVSVRSTLFEIYELWLCAKSIFVFHMIPTIKIHYFRHVAEALCYKPESRRFDPLDVGIFNWPNPSSRTTALESTQPLKEMSTRNLPGG